MFYVAIKITKPVIIFNTCVWCFFKKGSLLFQQFNVIKSFDNFLPTWSTASPKSAEDWMKFKVRVFFFFEKLKLQGNIDGNKIRRLIFPFFKYHGIRNDQGHGYDSILESKLPTTTICITNVTKISASSSL